MTGDTSLRQPGPALVHWLDGHRWRTLEAYRADSFHVVERANQEGGYRAGGYAGRQLLGLVQNTADALHRSGARGRLPLSNGRLRLVGEMRKFPREFLLFVLTVFALRLKIDGDADMDRPPERSLRRRNTESDERLVRTVKILATLSPAVASRSRHRRPAAVERQFTNSCRTARMR